MRYKIKWFLEHIAAPILVLILASFIPPTNIEPYNYITNNYNSISLNSRTINNSAHQQIKEDSSKRIEDETLSINKTQTLLIYTQSKLRNGKISINDEWVANAPSKILVKGTIPIYIKVTKGSFYYEEMIQLPTNRTLINILNKDVKTNSHENETL